MATGTRGQARATELSLMNLPEGILQHIVQLASQDESWQDRSRLALVCRAFRSMSRRVAFLQHGMRLDLDSLCWPISTTRRKVAARKSLLGAVAAVAPSARALELRGKLPASAGVRLDALLQPLAPHVRALHVQADAFCAPLLCCVAEAPFSALEEVTVGDCNVWEDLSDAEQVELCAQLAAHPQLVSKITRLECCERLLLSCCCRCACLLLLLLSAAAAAGCRWPAGRLLARPGTSKGHNGPAPPPPTCAACYAMEDEERGEAFLRHFTALRSLELDYFAHIARPWALAAMLRMPHLGRLTLTAVSRLEEAMPALLALTQARPWTRRRAAAAAAPPPAAGRQGRSSRLLTCAACRLPMPQVQELLLLSCRPHRSMTQLSNLMQLDMGHLADWGPGKHAHALSPLPLSGRRLQEGSRAGRARRAAPWAACTWRLLR